MAADKTRNILYSFEFASARNVYKSAFFRKNSKRITRPASDFVEPFFQAIVCATWSALDCRVLAAASPLLGLHTGVEIWWEFSSKNASASSDVWSSGAGSAHVPSNQASWVAGPVSQDFAV